MTRYIDADIAHEMLLRGYVINDVPTADVQEVKRGKWERSALNFFKCSVCSAIWNRKFKYCSHCGAKMDGNDRKDGEVRNG